MSAHRAQWCPYTVLELIAKYVHVKQRRCHCGPCIALSECEVERVISSLHRIDTCEACRPHISQCDHVAVSTNLFCFFVLEFIYIRIKCS